MPADSEQPAVIRTEFVQIHGSRKGWWPRRQVYVDSRAKCCTVTRSFLEATGTDEGLTALKCDYQCGNPDHVGAVELQVSAVDSLNFDRIRFCVLNDQEAYAVMTENQPCFKPKIKGHFIAPTTFVGRVLTAGE